MPLYGGRLYNGQTTGKVTADPYLVYSPDLLMDMERVCRYTVDGITRRPFIVYTVITQTYSWPVPRVLTGSLMDKEQVCRYTVDVIRQNQS